MARPYDHNWQRIRLTILERDAHTCKIAGPRCTTHATEVDHIVPLAEGGARLDPTNLRAACQPCNLDRVKQRQRAAIATLQQTTKTPSPSRAW